MPGTPLRRALLGLALPLAFALSAQAEPPFLERRDWWPFESSRLHGGLGADEALAPLDIALPAARFRPSLGEPALPRELAFTAEEASAPGQPWIVQLDWPVTAEARHRLEAAGARVIGVAPRSAYLVRSDEPAGLGELPGVRWAAPYHPAYRLDPLIGSAPTLDPVTASGQVLPLRVLLFPDADKRAVAAGLAELGAEIDEAATWDPRDSAGRVYFRASPLVLLEAARLPSVRLIQELVLAGRLHAVETKPVIQSGSVMGGTPYHDAGILGVGHVAGIADSGLDVDTILMSETELDAGFVGPTHRKVLSYVAVGGGDLMTCGGVTGYSHGTNVSQNALGNRRDFGLDGNLDGTAPGAKVTFFDMQAVTDFACQFGLVNPPASLTGSYEDTHAAGGRVYNGSFGLGMGYANHSMDADQYLWDHRDAMWMFAAGNGGAIGSPASAKNVVAVGGYYQDPYFDFFGSMGPAPDGRMAPTVMAPACDRPGGNPAPFDYDTATNVTNDDGDYEGTPSSTLNQGVCGTSFASPFTTGAAILVLDYFEQGFYPSGAASAADSFVASGALVKAVFLNSGEYMDCGTCGGVRMSGNQGMGRLNLSLSLPIAGDSRTAPAVRVIDQGMGTGLQTGVSQTERVTVTDPSVPLRATLAWVDVAQSALVNDLQLTVTGPAGTPEQTYLGNNFTREWSDSMAAGGMRSDSVNPFESVIVNPAELVAGEWSVRVEGVNVPMGDPLHGATQPFALVISGGFGALPPTETDCCNGVDDDGDGAVDFDDSDCAMAPPCTEIDCCNGVDDDGDGDVDFDDSDCDTAPLCAETFCDDGLDDDADGDVDCDDSDCLIDADGDGLNGLPCGFDCNDADPGVQAPPEQVTGLVWSAPDTLSWDDQSGTAGSAISYSIVRGLVADLPVQGALSEACLDDALASPSYADPATPPPDTAWWYLAGAANSCLPDGAPWGFTSTGLPRSPTPCP